MLSNATISRTTTSRNTVTVLMDASCADEAPPAQDAHTTSPEAIPAEANKSMQSNTESSCRLKRLPAEIRNEIFSLAAVQDKPIRVMLRTTLPHETIAFKLVNPRSPPTGLALSHTCRQFRKEVGPMVYDQNTFILMPNLCAAKGPQPDALAFPFALLNRLIINIHKDSRRGADGELHVEKGKDQTIAITAVDLVRRYCICKIKNLAQNCTGSRCMEDFVTRLNMQPMYSATSKQLDRDLIYKLRFDSYEEQLRCDDCGSAPWLS